MTRRHKPRTPAQRPADAHLALGDRFLEAGRFDEAQAAYGRALNIEPSSALAHRGLADVLARQGRLDDALEHCRTAVALGRARPHSSVYVSAGRILEALGRYDEAIAAFSSAIQVDAREPEAYVGLGIAYEGAGRPLEAFAAYQKSLEIRPGDARVYNNLAAILIGLKQIDLAISTARAAVSLAPDHPDIHLNLAAALKLKGGDAEATEVYETILGLNPEHGEALVELHHRRQHACDWHDLPDLRTRFEAHSYRAGRIVSPFSVMTATTSPAEQLLCGRAWDRAFSRLAPLTVAAPRPLARRREKIRLGYLSADFHAHATAMLVADLIEQHDRDAFTLLGYSLGPDDGSPLRRRLADGFETFVDLRGTGDLGAARRIQDDGVDILLDLKGFTQNARVKILAYRPAPIQVNYLGFPGTMGLTCIDYIIADAHVAPFADAAFFAEKIVHLPNSYQPNDRQRVIAQAGVRRSDFGLPETGFIFCSFNAAYKITPQVFDIWMRLLKATPGSVLWLLETNPIATANLRREAESRNVAADRLVFAPFVAVENHLERLSLADLFLDTFPVNAHTTASEALWVGVPIVTCAGETFASRVASSLLNATGLPDLVTPDLAAYEAYALRLTRTPSVLADMRRRLSEGRSSAPLFDTPRYARHFEAALRKMVERRDAGLQPDAFAIDD